MKYLNEKKDHKNKSIIFFVLLFTHNLLCIIRLLIFIIINLKIILTGSIRLFYILLVCMTIKLYLNIQYNKIKSWNLLSLTEW